MCVRRTGAHAQHTQHEPFLREYVEYDKSSVDAQLINVAYAYTIINATVLVCCCAFVSFCVLRLLFEFLYSTFES